MSKPHTKVYDALIEVFAFKNNTTIRELAILTGYKQIDVIRILNMNKHLLYVKKSKICSFSNVHTYNLLEQQYQNGITYRIEKANYNTMEVISVHTKIPEIEALRKRVWFGGLGDSYPADVIMNTPENLKVVQDAGLFEYMHNAEQFSVKSLWKENEV